MVSMLTLVRNTWARGVGQRRRIQIPGRLGFDTEAGDGRSKNIIRSNRGHKKLP